MDVVYPVNTNSHLYLFFHLLLTGTFPEELFSKSTTKRYCSRGIENPVLLCSIGGYNSLSDIDAAFIAHKCLLVFQSHCIGLLSSCCGEKKGRFFNICFHKINYCLCLLGVNEILPFILHILVNRSYNKRLTCRPLCSIWSRRNPTLFSEGNHHQFNLSPDGRASGEASPGHCRDARFCLDGTMRSC